MKLFEIEPLKEPQQIGWVFYDKMNLVQKSKFIKQITTKIFFTDFLYKKFDDFDHFKAEATKKSNNKFKKK
jgi:hypothetical protein